MEEAMQLLNQIIDAEAAYFEQHGEPPRVLNLPVLQAYTLAKLRYNQIGELSGQVMMKGIKAFEEFGLFGVPVKLVRGQQQFSFA